MYQQEIKVKVLTVLLKPNPRREVSMKAALLAISLCIGAMPVFAADHGEGRLSDHTGGVARHKPAPAPLVGLGIPVVLAVGGALLGAKLLNRKR
jgi:hypothetical protein